MRKFYPHWQGRIYAHIFQIIWQYKKNFHKTILGISKSLFFLFKYIVESSVDWILRKQSEIFRKCINFTSINYIYQVLGCWGVAIERIFSKNICTIYMICLIYKSGTMNNLIKIHIRLLSLIIFLKKKNKQR